MLNIKFFRNYIKNEELNILEQLEISLTWAIAHLTIGPQAILALFTFSKL